MKFMCMIYVDESDPRSAGSPDDLAAHAVFVRKTIAAGQYVTCDALDRTPSAATVRVRDGRVYRTDGPFAETKEAIGGFYILECKDLDEAVALAAEIPPAKHGSIEVRPIMEIPGWEESIGLPPRTVPAR